ncbi:MAG TPA: hypothetical protein VGB63_18410 [Pedobacter sp.]|jgi:hypothetical protein
MKQSTKVLLPLGLFMSIVIPVTVKSLFTDSAFFDISESSQIEYLQPYSIKPVAGTESLNLNEVTVEPSTLSNSQNISPVNQSRLSRQKERDKVDLPTEALIPDEIQGVDQPASIDTDDLFK